MTDTVVEIEAASAEVEGRNVAPCPPDVTFQDFAVQFGGQSFTVEFGGQSFPAVA